MSKYSELCEAFTPWAKKWSDLHFNIRKLPKIVELEMMNFLGCPEYFKSISANENIKYVSYTNAEMDYQTGEFLLTIGNGGLAEIEINDSGEFFFGLRIILECAPQAHPKQGFWFLFRCTFDCGSVVIRSEKTKIEFRFGVNETPGPSFYEHIFETIMKELLDTPTKYMSSRGTSIGFVKLKESSTSKCTEI